MFSTKMTGTARPAHDSRGRGKNVLALSAAIAPPGSLLNDENRRRGRRKTGRGIWDAGCLFSRQSSRFRWESEEYERRNSEIVPNGCFRGIRKKICCFSATPNLRWSDVIRIVVLFWNCGYPLAISKLSAASDIETTYKSILTKKPRSLPAIWLIVRIQSSSIASPAKMLQTDGLELIVEEIFTKPCGDFKPKILKKRPTLPVIPLQVTSKDRCPPSLSPLVRSDSGIYQMQSGCSGAELLRWLIYKNSPWLDYIRQININRTRPASPLRLRSWNVIISQTVGSQLEKKFILAATESGLKSRLSELISRAIRSISHSTVPVPRPRPQPALNSIKTTKTLHLSASLGRLPLVKNNASDTNGYYCRAARMLRIRRQSY